MARNLQAQAASNGSAQSDEQQTSGDQKKDKKRPDLPGGALGMLAKLPPLVPQSPVMEPVVSKEQADAGPKVQQYRVMEDARYSVHGHVTTLRKGKLIDERNYDIEKVKKQGIKLEEV